MKLPEYKQLVAGKLGIRQDTVKQQRVLIRRMIDNNMNDPNHGIAIKAVPGIRCRCRAWFHGGVAPRYKPLDMWMDDGATYMTSAGFGDTCVESVNGRAACLDCVDFRHDALVAVV